MAVVVDDTDRIIPGPARRACGEASMEISAVRRAGEPCVYSGSGALRLDAGSATGAPTVGPMVLPVLEQATDEAVQRARLLSSRDGTVEECKARSQALSVIMGHNFVIKSTPFVDMAIDRWLSTDGSSGVLVHCDRLVLLRQLSELELCKDAGRILQEPNAGGQSTNSEVLSMEYLARRLRAHSVVTEMEVKYWSSHWKRCDFLCTIMDRRVGVSVTRAMGYPTHEAFQMEDARRLMRKKLDGLVVAREGVVKAHAFSKSILHIWAPDTRIASLLRTAFDEMQAEPEMVEDVLIIITIAGSCAPLFYEKESNSLATQGRRKVGRESVACAGVGAQAVLALPPR